LIVWGLLRLVEIVIWRATAKPLPARGLSGGEWTLVIFIILIGSGLVFASRHAQRLPSIFIGDKGLELFGDAYDYTLSTQKPIDKVVRVVVENPRGNTRIIGGDSQEVVVSGRKTIRAMEKSAADEADRKTPVEIVIQGDQAVVRTNQDAVSGERRVSMDLEITVPRKINIQASGRYGDFDITNIEGLVEISSDNAGVRLQDIGGNTRVDLRRSDIVRAINMKGNVEVLGRGRDVELEDIAGQVEVNGHYSGDLIFRRLAKPVIFSSGQTEMRIERLPGQLHIDLGDFNATNVVGPLRLRSGTKDVQLEEFAGPVEIAIERGDLHLAPGKTPLSKIEATTDSGEIDLALPETAKFELKVETKRGEIANDFGAPLEAKTEFHGGTIAGAVGSGPKISMSTGRGSITVRKGARVPPGIPAEAEHPEPPTPPAPPR
jgi:DUF4097 and DUF4098 domain-containing protein YvlB